MHANACLNQLVKRFDCNVVIPAVLFTEGSNSESIR